MTHKIKYIITTIIITSLLIILYLPYKNVLKKKSMKK